VEVRIWPYTLCQVPWGLLPEVLIFENLTTFQQVVINGIHPLFPFNLSC
jgi:hypothetical protein